MLFIYHYLPISGKPVRLFGFRSNPQHRSKSYTVYNIYIYTHQYLQMWNQTTHDFKPQQVLVVRIVCQLWSQELLSFQRRPAASQMLQLLQYGVSGDQRSECGCFPSSKNNWLVLLDMFFFHLTWDPIEEHFFQGIETIQRITCSRSASPTLHSERTLMKSPPMVWNGPLGRRIPRWQGQLSVRGT